MSSEKYEHKGNKSSKKGKGKKKSKDKDKNGSRK